MITREERRENDKALVLRLVHEGGTTRHHVARAIILGDPEKPMAHQAYDRADVALSGLARKGAIKYDRASKIWTACKEEENP